MFPQSWSLLTLALCFTFLKMMKRGDQDDHQRQKSNNETRIPNPQSCAWLVIWQNQPGPKDPNQIRWHQKTNFADILTKDNFTRDDWRNLLHRFNISIFRSVSCLETMSKRMQQGTGGEKIVPKSKPMLNLVSHAAASSSTASSSSASNRPGILRAPSQQGSNLTAKRCRETCSWRFKSEYRSVKFSSVASRCKDERQCEETRCYRNKPETWIFQPVQGDFPQKNQTTSTTQSGRLITAYLVLRFHISRKSSRICDSNMVASQETKWKTSKPIVCYGECLCLSLCAVHLGKDYLENLHSTKKSATMNSETNVRSDKDHSSNRNSR